MDVSSFGPLLSAIGGLLTGIIAVIAFWMSRAANEAKALKTANDAQALATAAHAKIDAGAREYATHRDLAQTEARMASSIGELRDDMRGITQRLDRVLEGMAK